MNNLKKQYVKPTVKLAKWDFSNAVCQTIVSTSVTKCISVTKGVGANTVEIRNETTGEWNRVGSR